MAHKATLIGLEQHHWACSVAKALFFFLASFFWSQARHLSQSHNSGALAPASHPQFSNHPSLTRSAPSARPRGKWQRINLPAAASPPPPKAPKESYLV